MTTSLRPPLSSVSKQAVLERFDCITNPIVKMRKWIINWGLENEAIPSTDLISKSSRYYATVHQQTVTTVTTVHQQTQKIRACRKRHK